MLGLQQELSTAIAEQVRLRLSPERLDALSRRQTRNAKPTTSICVAGTSRTSARRRRPREPSSTFSARRPSIRTTRSRGRASPSRMSPARSTAMRIRSRSDPVPWPRSRRRSEPIPTLSTPSSPGHRLPSSLNGTGRPLRRLPGAQSRSIPETPWPNRVLGNVLSHMGRHAEAQPEMRRGRELDPLFAMEYAISSQVAFQAGDYALALEHARHTIALDPDFWIGHLMLAQAHEQLGQSELALDALDACGAIFRIEQQDPLSQGLRAGEGWARGGGTSVAGDAGDRFAPALCAALHIRAHSRRSGRSRGRLRVARAGLCRTRRASHLSACGRQMGCVPRRSRDLSHSWNAATSCARPGPPLRPSERQSRGIDGNRVSHAEGTSDRRSAVYCLLFISISASAQPTQQLSGVVRDATGSVLPGVTVTVTGAALVAPRVVMTDQHGRYELGAARGPLPDHGHAERLRNADRGDRRGHRSSDARSGACRLLALRTGDGDRHQDGRRRHPDDADRRDRAAGQHTRATRGLDGRGSHRRRAIGDDRRSSSGPRR